MNARRSDRNSNSVDAAKTIASKGKQASVACIDLFCGAGGLTHGLEREMIPVVAGIDLDPACKYPYEKNNEAVFLERDIAEVSGGTLKRLFRSADVRVLAGCAPCQPFSTYAQRYSLEGDTKWGLLYEFARLVSDVVPEIVTMENVPTVSGHVVFDDFLSTTPNQTW